MSTHAWTLAAFALVAAAWVTPAAQAAPPSDAPSVAVEPARDAPEPPETRSPWSLEVGGYGDLQFAFHDFGPNRNREGGSQRDARVVFDTTRFVLRVEGELPHDVEFEAEVEFEHGGTGAALELEYEEFGEFEQEVEKGGEVLLEELYLKKGLGEHVSLALGRFYVAVGLLYDAHLPTEYLSATRSEAETTVIPAVWNEQGLELQATFDAVRLTAQVVNGLDSTAFSSQRWVASGHQARFELVSATELAFVGRADYVAGETLTLGVSGYYGDTTGNRPKADLVPDCPGGAADVVAPCGRVSAPVTILDVHGRFRWGVLRGSGLALFGMLDNAEAVSRRNDRLSNALGVLRTPVAEQALAASGELGVDVAPALTLGPAHSLEPFVHFERYDTMFAVREGLFDNPRFAVTVLGAGVDYTLEDSVVLKTEATHRTFGADSLRAENSLWLSAGFVY